jgi:phosphoglycolate phosphatase-like HAD superfamily hydrolase
VKLLLFDLDGTLVSTGGAGVRALNRACRQVLALENAMAGIQPHGKTDPAIIREIFAARRREEQVADFTGDILEAYLTFLVEEVEQSPSYRVLPGIERLLSEFAGSREATLGLATGNVETGARIKLSRGNLNRYFSFGGFGSDAENRTDLVRLAAERGARECHFSVSASDTFVIGDTPRDVQAGREAGFRTIGVATSSYTIEDLNDAGADLAITDFEQGRDQFLRVTRMA